MYPIGPRLVLDELYELVPINDLAGGRRKVLAHLEGIGVDHAQTPLFQVRGEVAGAVNEAHPPRLHDALEGRGVGEKEVDWGHRVHELLEVELEGPLFLGFPLP